MLFVPYYRNVRVVLAGCGPYPGILVPDIPFSDRSEHHPMKRVLVVDDEESILKVVDYALSQAGYEVHTAHDGTGAEFMFSQVKPDLVILDIMLPGKSGLDIARDLRAESNVPIIML